MNNLLFVIPNNGEPTANQAMQRTLKAFGAADLGLAK